jgi:hypothetical protein
MCHLRRKLGTAAAAITTVRGHGFRFDGRKLTGIHSTPHNLRVVGVAEDSDEDRELRTG